jgi:hypothetical protein
MRAKKLGVFSFNLENVFQHEQGSIYSDHIHFRLGPDGVSRGNDLVAKAMADRLAKAWKLRPKK